MQTFLILLSNKYGFKNLGQTFNTSKIWGQKSWIWNRHLRGTSENIK